MGKIIRIKTWFVFPLKLNLWLRPLIIITGQHTDISAALLHHPD